MQRGDINRKPSAMSMHNVHQHTCPECKRGYSCNCQQQSTQSDLVCIDCERNPGWNKEKE